MNKDMKRGDIILEFLYQIYEDGSAGGKTGFGSFMQNVAIRIIELIDDGILTKKGPQDIDGSIFKVERPISSPSISISK